MTIPGEYDGNGREGDGQNGPENYGTDNSDTDNSGSENYGTDDQGSGNRTFDAYEADEQLSLAGNDDALPWLEADEDEAEPATDYRILIFAALAVVALAGILFGANHFLSDRTGGNAVADGSTIAAPEGDYKMRPDQAGGTEVAGTGDLSFEVGEGQGRESRLGSNDATPSIDIDQQPAAARPTAPGATPAAGGATPAPAATRTPEAQGGGVGVQVGAYSTRASAETGWSQLSGRYAALQGLNHRVIEGTADSGTIFRLQAVTGNAAAADALCRSIRSAGGDCQVKR